ncbi:MAG TPA: 50S ribosomal protein L3 N(5)-glutamine methyltransferase [Spongiibacteraceae bacterium]|nr:50S ribosomal protein L3 N(5)-glutamine methyltransferase [Spongiibacteraceae bacterium]
MAQDDMNDDEIIEELHTIRDYVRWGMTQFQRAGCYYGHGTDNAYDEALGLVLHTLALPIDIPLPILDARLIYAERDEVLRVLRARFEDRLPAPYITGEAWFAGYPFTVDERVLIPRSPLAELIEQRFAPWLSEARDSYRILDLCTGSGCIGIACALYLPEAEVVISDISDDALDVAAMNVQRHDAHDRVQVVQSDLFAALEGERFDVIVSNPPYVDAQDMAALPPEYEHEPRLALEAGDDGLDLVCVMLSEAAEHLNEGGLLIVEVGNSWVALEEAFPNVPFTWLEFERGGEGVFLLTREQLLEHADEF